MLHVYFLHCILSFFFGLAFSVFAPLSLCLPFAIYFLATTRFNSKTSNLFPYLSSHCWSKNIEHILSFIHAPPSSFSFFSHSLSRFPSHCAYAAAAASLHSTQLSQFCLLSFVRLVTPSTRLPNRPPFSLSLLSHRTVVTMYVPQPE